MTTTRERTRPVDKHDERRNQLAESALVTLGELGYAKSSLREIANNSEFTHGVVHYYFHDKFELIVYCVKYYKSQCVRRYDGVVADATRPRNSWTGSRRSCGRRCARKRRCIAFGMTLRSQSMFEESLREAVTMIDRTLEQMIWRVVSRYAELAGREPVTDSAAAYGLLDGLFQQALLGYVADDETALDTLSTQVHSLMPLLLSPSA